MPNPIGYSVYGDESTSQEIVSYGLVTFRDQNVLATESEIRNLKAYYGADPDERLHCRVLFAGTARQKTSYKHLSLDRICDLYSDVIIAAMAKGVQFHTGWTRKNAAPRRMVIPMAEPVGRTPPVVLDDKHLSIFAFVAAIAPLSDQLGVGNFRLYIDPDTTRIDWFGPHRQVQNLLRIMSNGQHTIEPEAPTAAKPSLLEIADLVGYATARAFASPDVSNRERCIELFTLMAPQHSQYRFVGQVDAERHSWDHLPLIKRR